jgi:hypothetical protein
MKATTLQRAAAAILMVLGLGHLTLMVLFEGPAMLRWFERGLWAAVPLKAPEPTVEALKNALAFWPGIGSFAVPTFVLGAFLWSLARQDVRPGVWLGWVLAGWWAVFALLLVPSPAIFGVIAGLLLVMASRRSTASETDS